MTSQYCPRWLEEIRVLIIDFLTVAVEFNEVKHEYLYKAEVPAANLKVSLFCTVYIATTAL
jgi:hypothetical protein